MSASDGALARVLEGVSRWMLTHRVVVVLTAVIWVVVSSLGLGRLGFKNDYRMFFSTENPELLAFESLQRTFTKADNILIAVTPRQGDLPTRERLGAIEALTNQTWQLPGATRVDSITNFQDSFAEGDEIVVQDMARRAATLSDEQIARIRQRILAEPLIVGRLINKAGTVTGINVMFEFDDDDKDAAVVRAANAARELVARARQSYPDLEFRLTGGVMLDAAFSDSAEADIKFLTPVMLTVSIGLIAYFLGSLWATLVTTAVISGSVLCALGWAGYLGIALSPSSLAAPTILMTMAVADSVHFLTGYYTRLEATSDRVEAMIHSLVSHIPAVFFTSAATIASFLTLNFSDAPPFRDLGNITAMGVGAAFVLSLTLLPAVITFVPVAHARRRFEGLKRFLERVFTLIERVPQRIAVVGIIACLLLTALAFFNRIDDRYVQYFGESLSFRQDTDYVDANLTGIYAIEYPLKAQGPDGINDPGFLRDVEAFGAWLRTQPEVTHVYSVADILKKLNMNMNGDDPAFYRMPDNRKLAAQYLLTYELSLPQGVNLIDRVDVNRSAIRLTATLRNVSSQQVLDLEERAQAWMKQHMPAYMHVAGTGASLMFAHIGQRNILAMISGELMGMALVSLLMILYLRSLSLGLLSMIPNLLPAGVAIGIWYLAVGEVGLTSSVVAAMTLGILTDDTVHFLEKYARHHRTMAVRDAVARAFQEAGPAIWITSLVLISGFAVLALSSFQINSDLGILTVIILALGLVGDFVLLPAVLLSLESVRKAAFTVPRHLNSRESVMKVLIFAAGLASAGLLAGPSLIAQTPEERGLSIAVETDARDAGFGNWLASAKMVLRDKQGGEAVRTFRMMALEQKDDGDKTLVVFDKPADLAGAAVLTYSHALVPDDQWLYLPEVRRVKRISAQNKAALFMGSEFAYEDLSSWEVKKYGYRYLRDETIDGEDCFVVENTPAYADSAYSKQIEWVDKKLYHPRRLDYYDRQGRLLKTMTFSGYQQYLGKHWRASEQLMRNHQTGKATQIVWGPYKFKTTIHESEFTPEALTRSR